MIRPKLLMALLAGVVLLASGAVAPAGADVIKVGVIAPFSGAVCNLGQTIPRWDYRLSSPARHTGRWAKG